MQNYINRNEWVHNAFHEYKNKMILKKRQTEQKL